MTKIQLEEKDGYQIMHLVGEFIGGTETDKLSSSLKKTAQSELNYLVLDLSGVSFLNSMALGVLLSANALFHKQGGKVVLSNPSDYLKSIFETTKLNLIFTIEKSIEDAVITLKKQ